MRPNQAKEDEVDVELSVGPIQGLTNNGANESDVPFPKPITRSGVVLRAVFHIKIVPFE